MCCAKRMDTDHILLMEFRSRLVHFMNFSIESQMALCCGMSDRAGGHGRFASATARWNAVRYSEYSGQKKRKCRTVSESA